MKCLNKKQTSIPTLHESRQFHCYYTDREKAKLLNNHFSHNFNNSLPPLLPDNVQMTDSSDIPEDLLCTVEEMTYLLSTINPSKASGPDRISARMLRSTASNIAPAITKLFNLSLILGKLPKEWKVAQVTPIPKSSLTTDPANYRPVSLLSILSKLLEKHIQSVILEHWRYIPRSQNISGALLRADP